MTPIERSSVSAIVGMLAIGTVVGRLLPPLAVRFYGEAPIPGVSSAVWLLLGAVVVAMIALQNWRTLHRDKRQMASQHALRVLAIAKAAVIVACVFTGGYLGLALFAFGAESELGRLRFWRSLLAAGAGALLLAAALALEWTCKLPEDDDPDSSSAGAADPSPA